MQIQLVVTVTLIHEQVVPDGKTVKTTKHYAVASLYGIILSLTSEICGFVYSFHIRANFFSSSGKQTVNEI